MSIVFLIIFSLFIATLCCVLERKLIRRTASSTYKKAYDTDVAFDTWLTIARAAIFVAFFVASVVVLVAYELCKTLYLSL